jgi:hypothetical protein
VSSTVEQEVGQIPPVEGSTLGEVSTSTAIAIRDDETSNGSIAAFASQQNFVAAQRIAKALASSSLVPKAYQGPNGVANCLVAMELASRTGASVLMVMQNLHVIQGRPSWSAAFLIASINSCGRFSPLRYQFQGSEAQAGWRCRAVARDLASGDILEGEWITWEMVHGEGWLAKPGSKWKTMPGQMIRYRAASFWVRTYAPEISIGMHSAEEVADTFEARSSTATADINAAIRAVDRDVELADATIVETTAPVAANTPPTVKSIDERAPLDVPKGKKCKTCFRSDGTHDPNATCYAD